MSAEVADAVQKVLLVVLGFALGFFNPPIVRWWRQRHAKADAARIFRRELETLLGPFGAVKTHCDRKNGLLEGIGPSIFRQSIENITESVALFESRKATRFDLQDDELEDSLVKFYEGVERSRDQLEKYARPWYPENRHEGMVFQVAYQQIEMFRSGAETTVNNANALIKRLRELK